MTAIKSKRNSRNRLQPSSDETVEDHLRKKTRSSQPNRQFGFDFFPDLVAKIKQHSMRETAHITFTVPFGLILVLFSLVLVFIVPNLHLQLLWQA